MKSTLTPPRRRTSKGAIGKVLLVVLTGIAVIAIAFLGWNRFRDMGIAGTEAEAQKQEEAECRKRLAGFHSAWKKYIADHNGRTPGGVSDLVPKYITDPALLVCPTAQRWQAKGTAMQSGSIKIKDKTFPVTYRFLVFTASYPIQQRKHGDKTVLIDCDSHQEGMYRAVFHRAPKLGAFEGVERASLPDEVGHTKQIVLRKDGTVESQSEEQ